ncbi:MAG: hypothetical protein C4524_15455 [Candidatus Zixiibacteriota bacterium]|nr:MAG: hypothetical protein C4524_15455 [candidate division Zixibacteria bacterium]
MFIGHYALGLAGKKAVPAVSLGTLLLAAQWIDLIWPILLLLGLERVRPDPGNTAFTPLDFYHYPITHSLLMVLVWGLLVGGVYYTVKRQWRGAWVLGALVVSHWALDFLTHRPDLPLAPGSDRLVGLGLWNNVAASLIVEGILFAAGVALYLRATRAKDRTGVWAFWGLIALLVVSWVGSLAGPPPPDWESVAWLGLALWLTIPWGYWIDRHREPRESGSRRVLRDGRLRVTIME